MLRCVTVESEHATGEGTGPKSRCHSIANHLADLPPGFLADPLRHMTLQTDLQENRRGVVFPTSTISILRSTPIISLRKSSRHRSKLFGIKVQMENPKSQPLPADREYNRIAKRPASEEPKTRPDAKRSKAVHDGSKEEAAQPRAIPRRIPIPEKVQ